MLHITPRGLQAVPSLLFTPHTPVPMSAAALNTPTGVPVGTKEITEVLDALGFLGAAIIRRVRDGIDAGDILAVLGDAEVRAAIAGAIEGARAIPAEIANLDLDEAFGLAEASLRMGRRVAAGAKAA